MAGPFSLVESVAVKGPAVAAGAAVGVGVSLSKFRPSAWTVDTFATSEPISNRGRTKYLVIMTHRNPARRRSDATAYSHATARWRNTWSTSTSAAIASTIGTARGSTQGS